MSPYDITDFPDHDEPPKIDHYIRPKKPVEWIEIAFTITNDGSFDDPKPLWFFLDDEREPPSTRHADWIIFRTGESMIQAIRRMGLPDGISFDHDLGEDGMDGHETAKKIRELVLDGTVDVPAGFEYTVHSANPVGKQNIIGVMKDVMLFKVLH